MQSQIYFSISQRNLSMKTSHCISQWLQLPPILQKPPFVFILSCQSNYKNSVLIKWDLIMNPASLLWCSFVLTKYRASDHMRHRSNAWKTVETVEINCCRCWVYLPNTLFLCEYISTSQIFKVTYTQEISNLKTRFPFELSNHGPKWMSLWPV